MDKIVVLLNDGRIAKLFARLILQNQRPDQFRLGQPEPNLDRHLAPSANWLTTSTATTFARFAKLRGEFMHQSREPWKFALQTVSA